MWKKIRKNKRPWKWPKPFYSVHQFLKDSEICFRTKWEIRKIFMEEIDKKYQKWLEIETKKWNMTMHIKSLMYELEKMLEKNNELRIEWDKYWNIDKTWKEKKYNEADEFLNKTKFILDVIGLKEKTNASEFLIPTTKNLK